jgi:hypothetical protein
LKNAKLNDLELIIGVYRFLCFDFEKYSTRWNFSLLIKFIQKTSGSSSTAENTVVNPVQENKDNMLKWFTLKIYSLLLSLTPIQINKLLAMHFNAEECGYFKLL